MTLEESTEKVSTRCIAEIQLILNHPSMEGKVLVVIEGDDDKKLYDRLFNKNETKLHPVGGCAHYEEILDNLNKDYENRLIVIKDADFDRLNNQERKYENFFITDGHDAEMMIANENFERALQNEFLSGDAEPIIERVNKDIKNISFIKWYNNVKNKKVNVEKLKPDKGMYDGNNEVSIEDCICRISSDRSNKDIDIMTEDEILDYESRHQDIDLRELTIGHDLFDGICRKLYFENDVKNKRTGGKPVSQEISRLARTAYSSEQFHGTELYKTIKEWQEKKGCLLLK